MTRTRTETAGKQLALSALPRSLSSTPGRTKSTARKWGELSAPVKQHRMKGELMKKATSDHLTPEQRAETDALAALPDDKINTGDIPEQRDWSGAQRGALFRPVKQQITLRLDADLIEWFRRQPGRD